MFADHINYSAINQSADRTVQENHRYVDHHRPRSDRSAANRQAFAPAQLLIATALTGSFLALVLFGHYRQEHRNPPMRQPLTVAAQELTEGFNRFLPIVTGTAGKVMEALPDAIDQSLQEQDSTDGQVPDVDEPAGPPATISKTVSLGRGDTLLKLMTGAGADLGESHDAIEALRSLVNPRRLQLGQEIILTFERDEDDGLRLAGLDLAPSAERTVVVRRQDDGGFSADETALTLTPHLVRAGGTIDDSLFMTAQRAGIPANVMIEMIRLFSYDVDFQREVQPGDSFEVYFERLLDGNGKAVKDGRILSASMTLSGQQIHYYRYQPSDDNQPDYFNAKGQSVRKALLRTPVDGARLTSGFGRRVNPILGYSMMHKGVDFGAPIGTPVMAAGDGVVSMAGWNGAYGKFVLLRHNDNYSTAYAHLSSFGKIRQGQHVRQGEVIGYIGTTGRSTGPHLHYEVRVHDKQVNPLSVRLPTGRKLDGKELKRFLNAIGVLDQQIAQSPMQTRLAQSDN